MVRVDRVPARPGDRRRGHGSRARGMGRAPRSTRTALGTGSSPRRTPTRSRGGPRPGSPRRGSTPREVGVPIDFFYLAASGPLLAELFDRRPVPGRATDVFVDREPAYLAGRPDSPGDFVATGDGHVHTAVGVRHRWSYFVAAPGFGPVRQRRDRALGPVRRRRRDAREPRRLGPPAPAARPRAVRRDRASATSSRAVARLSRRPSAARIAVDERRSDDGRRARAVRGCPPRPRPRVRRRRPATGRRARSPSRRIGENVPLVTSPITRSPSNTG